MVREVVGHARRKSRAWLALALIAGVLSASCGILGGGGGSGSSTGNGSSTSGQAASGVNGPCPKNLVIQTDWFPEVEHGGTYQLIGRGGKADKATLTYSGPLQSRYLGAHGVQTVEIRAGGAAINKSVIDAMTADQSIFLGYINSDDVIAARAKDQRFIGVAATLDLSPQMVMWSPARYTITQFTDLARTKAKLVYFQGSTYVDFLVSKGYITADQLDPTYDGSPARWLATRGDILQQGFATSEPFTYRNDLDGWKREVDFFLIHWLGYENYPAMYSIRSDQLAASRSCLKLLVPVLQRAWVDYLADPAEVNDTIVTTLTTYDTFFKVSKALTIDANKKFRQFAIASNGSDNIYGNFDDARVARFIGIVEDIYRQRSTPLPALIPRDVTTNEFIDASVSMPNP